MVAYAETTVQIPVEAVFLAVMSTTNSNPRPIALAILFSACLLIGWGESKMMLLVDTWCLTKIPVLGLVG